MSSTFKANDGATLHRYFSKPSGKVRAIVIHFHGIGDHANAMGIKPYLDYMVTQDFAWHTMDLRYHGRSDGKNELIDDYKLMIEDTSKFVSLVAEENPDIPIFLSGHSMGGGFTIILSHKISSGEIKCPNYKGSILLAPMIENCIKPSAPIIFILKHLLLPIVPTWRSPYSIPLNMLLKDQKLTEEIKADKLRWSTGKGLKFQTGYEVLKICDLLISLMPSVSFPFLLLIAEDDKVICNSHCHKLFDQCKTPDNLKKKHSFPGILHLMLAHPEVVDEIYKVSKDWIEERIK